MSNPENIITGPENVMPNIFRRGQVWFWNDPQYLEKGKRIRIPPDIAGTHYSRYVVIVQDPLSANINTILVVPLSTKNTQTHDVKVRVDHLYVRKWGYAKVQNMFPAHPRALTSYTCELDPEAMDIISGEITKMLLPDLSEILRGSTGFQEQFRIKMLNETCDERTTDYTNDQINLLDFINFHIIYTIDKRRKLTIHELKQEYDRWCVMEGRQGIKYLDEFACSLVPLLQKTTTNYNGDPRWADEKILNQLVFYGVMLRNITSETAIDLSGNATSEPTPEPPKEEKSAPKPKIKHPLKTPDPSKVMGSKGEVINPPDDVDTYNKDSDYGNPKINKLLHDIAARNPADSKSFKWNDERMKAYIALYRKVGCVKCSELTGLTHLTANRYFSRFKRLTNDPVYADKPKKNSWKYTEEEIRQFLNMYLNKGDQAVSDFYHLTIGSIHAQVSKWKRNNMIPKDLLPAIEQRGHSRSSRAAEKEKKKNTTPSTPENSNAVQIDPNIFKGISLMSNIMRESVRRGKVYSTLNPSYGPNDFERRISSALYHSLLKILNISANSDNAVITPIVPKDSPLMWFYQFLTNIGDEQIFKPNDFHWDVLTSVYRQLYTGPFGIPKVYLKVLKERLITCKHTDEEGANLIVKCVSDFVYDPA